MPKLRSKDPRRRLASRFSGSRLALLAPPAGSRRWARRIDECVEFLSLLREAFPEYSDLSDSDLLAKTLTAHPAFRTWIREETDGSPPLAVAIRGQPTNYRLKPPPAYYGMRGGTYSRYAASTWIDEPAEYVGVVLPVILASAVWLRLFRRRLSAVG